MLQPSSPSDLVVGVYQPPIRITLEFPTYEAASAALARLNGVIAPSDRPDVGAPLPAAAIVAAVAPSPAEPTAAQVFGGAAAAANPPAAPASAAAAPSINVPAVPPASSTVPSAPSVPAAPTGSPAGVPTAPAAPTSPAGVEMDVDGLPWDSRIHAGGRAKNADGRWRQKRNLNDPALKARVEAELRQAMAAGAPVTPLVPQAPSAPVAPQPTAPVAPDPYLAGIAARNDAPQPPQAPAAPAVETFATLMVKITQAQAAGKLTEAKVGEALAAVHLSAPGQLAARPDLCPAVGAIIDGFITAAG